MKSTTIIGAIACSVLVASCMKLETNGVISVLPGKTIQFQDKSGAPMTLVDGNIYFSIRKFITKNPELKVQQRDQIAVVSIPKESLTSATDFYIRGSRVGLNFDMQGKRVERETGRRTEVRTIDCTGPGYCSKVDPDTNQPVPGYYPDCPGKKGQTVAIVSYVNVDKVSFLVPNTTNESLGEYFGTGGSFTRTIETAVEQRCNTL
jgi:hypothetical protein